MNYKLKKEPHICRQSKLRYGRLIHKMYAQAHT